MEVQLLGLPLRHRAALGVHVEGLLRELALIRLGREQDLGASLPARLLELAVDLDTTYAPYRAQQAQAMDDALAAGQVAYDAIYQASAASAAWVRHFSEVLEEADDFCRAQEHLLTAPAGREVVAFRRWLFGQILQQLAGQAPRPWRGTESDIDGDGDGDDASGTHRYLPGGHLSAGHVPAEPGRAPAGGPPLLPSVLPSTSGTGSEAGSVIGQPLVMDPLASAVARARRHVRWAVAEADAADVEESAELAVSELVTNAMLHARTAFTLTVRALPAGGVRVEVADDSPHEVVTRRHGLSATTGRGLQVVAAVSAAWGVEVFPDAERPGKCVWFEPRAGAGSAQVLTQEWGEDLLEQL
ncbi:ATP-binding protein [Kineococcus sp. SYSU DK001]|uniref:ATP-binding protein n=1 Tax=Kineococcus sp. SYSU DK001 TaxID=3383122 RepID=UPI003D7DAAFB